MIAQLFFMASVLVAAIAAPTADKYPAGLNPNLCPNYPHCDNALLAAHSQSAGHVGHAASYQTPASTYPLAGAYPGYAGYVNQGLGAYVGHPAGVYGGHSGGSYAAHGYPAGVDPASCPNYPYCTNYAPNAYHVAPLPGFSHRQYPDGVNPSVCPNYPFCH